MENCEVKEIERKKERRIEFDVEIRFKEPVFTENTIEDLQGWETSFDSAKKLKESLIEIFKR